VAFRFAPRLSGEVDDGPVTGVNAVVGVDPTAHVDVVASCHAANRIRCPGAHGRCRLRQKHQDGEAAAHCGNAWKAAASLPSWSVAAAVRSQLSGAGRR